MTGRLEYLAWAPTRQIFVERMQAYTNPVTINPSTGQGLPLAYIDEESGQLVPTVGVRIDEIGPVVKNDGVYDDEGNVVTPPTVVGGHHVNFWAYGPLEELLNANGGWVAIFGLLGDMEEMEATVEGVPAGWEGTSGMRIIHPSAVNHRVRIWA